MIALPEGPFGAILADPPWYYHNYSDDWHKRTDNSRWAGRKYPLMRTQDIAGLPVANIAARDCALFLWATMPCLPAALEVMSAWGFQHKTTAFVWVKTCKGDPSRDSVGMGYWTRSNAELVLFGTRGHPKRLSRSVRQIVFAPRMRHSEKPDEVHRRIEQLVAGPYCELFARRPYPGWSVWGNEVETP